MFDRVIPALEECSRYWKPIQKNCTWQMIPATATIPKSAAFTSWPAFVPSETGEPHRKDTFVPLDFDDKSSPEKALQEARQLLTYHLPELYEADPAWARYYCSGGKGFHVELPIEIFGPLAVAGHPLLPLIVKMIVADWKSRFDLKTLDCSIYNMGRGRMWRLPNVRRSNGRFKVPLTADEFQFMAPEELWALADSPRDRDNEVEEYPEIRPLPGLVAAFDTAMDAVASAHKKRSTSEPLSDEQREEIRGCIPDCVGYVIAQLPEKSDRVNFNRLAWLLADFFQAAGFTLEQALQYCEHFLSEYSHSDSYDTPQKREQEFTKLWHFCDGNESTAFNCKLVKSLGLPGSAFNCKKCDLKETLSSNGPPPEDDDPPNEKYTIWDEQPILLTETTLPELSVKLLPAPLAAIVQAVADASETPPELGVALALGSLATTVQRKIEIATDPGYQETLSLMLLAAMESGNRKSFVQKTMTQPLTDWERRHNAETLPDRERLKLDYGMHKKRLAALETKYASAGDDSMRQKFRAEIMELGPLPEPPVEPRIWADDITPEQLGQVMADNDERMAILSSEGGIFEIMGGRYNGNVPNFDVFLKGFAGDPLRVDRGSRPAIFLDRPALTVALSPQPDVITAISKVPGFRGRGLLARFLYVLPKSPLGYRKLTSRPIPNSVKAEYAKTLCSLMNIRPERTRENKIIPYVVRMSKAAFSDWKDFGHGMEHDIRPGNRFETMHDFAGKLPGTIARIAALFHCAENCDASPWEIPLSQPTMNSALELGVLLAAHGHAAFNLMKIDPQIEAAVKVWHWIERNLASEFTARDCFTGLTGSFPNMEAIQGAFNTLVERAYLRKMPAEKKAGRPSVRYEVNPYFSSAWR